MRGEKNRTKVIGSSSEYMTTFWTGETWRKVVGWGRDTMTNAIFSFWRPVLWSDTRVFSPSSSYPLIEKSEWWAEPAVPAWPSAASTAATWWKTRAQCASQSDAFSFWSRPSSSAARADLRSQTNRAAQMPSLPTLGAAHKNQKTTHICFFQHKPLLRLQPTQSLLLPAFPSSKRKCPQPLFRSCLAQKDPLQPTLQNGVNARKNVNKIFLLIYRKSSDSLCGVASHSNHNWKLPRKSQQRKEIQRHNTNLSIFVLLIRIRTSLSKQPHEKQEFENKCLCQHSTLTSASIASPLLLRAA